MTGLPSVQILLDDSTGAFPDDITSKVLLVDGIKFNRGRGDWQGGVTAGELNMTLNNADGRFTVGSTILGSPSPIKVDQRVRFIETPGGNLLAANQASFETSVADWQAVSGSPPAVAQDTTHVSDGTKAMRLTWTGGGGIPYVRSTVTGLAVGQAYTVAADVWAAVGSPDIYIGVESIGNSTATSTKGAFVRISYTFTATATTHKILVGAQSPTTAGQTWVDSVALNWGSTALPFASGGQTFTRFTGYVKQWPVAWPATVSTWATVPLVATDAQARAERQVLRSVIEEEILKDAPSAYYMLSEPAGSVSAADSSGNQSPPLTVAGSGTTPVTFGTDAGPTTDGLTAATFAAGGQYLTALGTAFRAVECAFTYTSGSQFNIVGQRLLYVDGATGTIRSATAASGILVGPRVDDGQVHVAATTWDGVGTTALWLDGVSVASVGSAFVLTSTPLYVGGDNLISSGAGTVSHVAMWATAAPSAARLAAHATAMLTGFAGELGTSRITRTAGYANLPVGTLDTGLTNVAFNDITGGSAWDAIQQVADAEMGVAFIDGSGNLTFHNRNRPAGKTTPDLTLAATYVAPGAQPIQDDQQIQNYVEATASATGVAQVARNMTSEANHGRYSNSKTYLVQTNAEALDRANWTTVNFAEPFTRFGTLTINLYAMTPTLAAQTLAAVDLDAWLRVTGLPSQTPGGTTLDVVIEGYSEEVTATSWELTLNVVAQSLFIAAIYDDATNGVYDSSRYYV